MMRSTSTFELRRFHGKEIGFVMIGTADAYRSLAQDLLVSTAHENLPEQTEYPPGILDIRINGPYSDRPDFTFSFHVPGSNAADKSLPLVRNDTSIILFLILTALCLIGFLTVCDWIANAIL